MQNSKLLKIVLLSFLIFAIVFGTSYSYFAAQGVGTGLENQATIKVGELKLVYEDGTDSFSTSGDFEPGDFMIKQFSITNQSSTTVYYKLYLDDVVNTFVMQRQNEDGSVTPGTPYELIYTLRKNGEEVITETSNTPVLQKAGIIYGSKGLGVGIESKQTDTYQLMIKFIDTGLNQNYNQAKMFSATINLEMKTMYEKLTSMMETREDMAIDDYDNIRFIGKDANNYISFNNEEWRVVGLFKDVEVVNDDGTTYNIPISVDI